MISLADLRARDVTPTWQEAVAVVQELLQTTIATTGSPDRLPDLEHVALIANGDVVALPGSLRPDNPVRHLAILLQLLTEQTPMPEQLTALIAANVADPPQHATAQAFGEALAFFERPGRKGDIERLVARAGDAEAQTRADEELQRLKVKAAEAAERAEREEPRPEESAADVRRDLRLPAALTAAAIIVFAAAGLYYWRVTSVQVVASVSHDATVPHGAAATAGETAQSASLLDKARQGLSAAVQAAKETMGGASPVKEVELPPAAIEAAQREAVPDRRLSRPEPSRAAPGEAERVEARPPAVRPEWVPVSEPVDETMELATVARATERGDFVYSGRHMDVVPPVLLRQMMPQLPPPDIPLDQLGVIELVIDRDGSVEQVRLAPWANRYQERMFVAHAKSWRFQPATRDGHPVKYRMRMRLTI